MVEELLARLRLVVAAVALTVLGVGGAALWGLSAVAVPAVVVSVGIPLLMICLPLVRRLADVHRRWAAALLHEPVPVPYRPDDGSPRPALLRLWARATDPATVRDLAWLFANSTLGLVLYLVAIPETVFGVLIPWLPRSLALRGAARLAATMLAPGPRSDLAVRVRQLTTSREETIAAQAAEIRRLERDLHDGAQARLVAVGMGLGMAEMLFERDPEQARTLVAQAREANNLALGELRDLVRGVHPPVLADRGLLAAVEALALSMPLPVSVRTDVPTQLPAPLETAVYFAVAECLANVVKHSGAAAADVVIRRSGGVLSIDVADDGAGGADVERGSGLAGVARRLGAFDGTLAVHSPPGGPTRVVMEVPCAS